MLVETLRADWTARGANARVHTLPEFDDGALTLGAGTKIAEARGNRRDEAAEGERAVALVSVALGRPLDASAATHVRRALAKAREGDAPLALTHLALAGAGRLDDPCEDARRLFIADGLMKAGVPPRSILLALSDDALAPADLERAYNPDQPRAPAGNGVVSGRWTSADWQAEASVSAQTEAPRVQVADASNTRGHEIESDASPALATPTVADAPSVVPSLLTSFTNSVPGAFYGQLAAQALHEGAYSRFALYEAAALLDAALGVVTFGEETEAEDALRRAAQLAANKMAGQAFENVVRDQLLEEGLEIGEQLTLVTASGVRTRVDFLTRNPVTGALGVVDAKSSAIASLTGNQERAFPEIELSGATIVGAGKPGFPGGMKIPPTRVKVIRQP